LLWREDDRPFFAQKREKGLLLKKPIEKRSIQGIPGQEKYCWADRGEKRKTLLKGEKKGPTLAAGDFCDRKELARGRKKSVPSRGGKSSKNERFHFSFKNGCL